MGKEVENRRDTDMGTEDSAFMSVILIADIFVCVAM